MLKKLTNILIVIFVLTICFASNSYNAIASAKDKSSFLITAINATQPAVAKLNIPALTQWILDESTNTLYAISKENKTLYFINAATMTIEKSLELTGSPTDIVKDNGNLYVALDDIKKIDVVDMENRRVEKELSTTSDPFRIVIDGNRLFYSLCKQDCVYAYDLTSNIDQVLSIDMVSQPDLAINTDQHILYIGGSGLSSSNLIYYSTIDNKVIGKTNYKNGFGYVYPERYTLYDGANVYYASRDFTPNNPQRCIGDFGYSNVIFAKNNFAFTNTSIYDAATHIKLGDYGSSMDLIEASDTTVYLYSETTGIIESFNNSNTKIDKSNIISLISGNKALPIQTNTNSVKVDEQVYSLKMNSNLTQWVLDQATNTLYGISYFDKALFFVNATNLNLEKSITFTSSPTDIVLDKGKLYISLDDINQIAVVDSVSRQTVGTLYTSSHPNRIVVDGNKLYYTEGDQWCKIYAYDLTSNIDQTLLSGNIYWPDLAINTDKHILYIGESGITDAKMIYYSTTDNKVIDKTDNEFSHTKRYTLFDDSMVYYASKCFDPEDPNKVLGSFDSDIIFAKYGYAFTNTAIYDSCTCQKLLDYGKVDLVEVSNRRDFYLYNIESKTIEKVEPTVIPPIINSVSPNTGSVKGGTVVNITGTGFTGASKVYFGSTLGTNLKVNSDTSITVTSPSSSVAGNTDIVIEGPNGINVISKSDRFKYIGLTVNVLAVNGSVENLLQSYGYGATVTLTAKPAKGYIFTSWTDKSGNILSTNQVYRFTITDDVELNANFVDCCDVNRDGKVNVLDLASVAQRYNMKNSNNGWVSKYDINNDGIIDIFDLALCSKKMIN